jgi:hypothetical protein
LKLKRIPPVEEPLAHIFPRNRLDVSGVDVRDTPLNFGAPRGLDVWFWFCVERFDEKTGQGCSVALGKLRRVTDRVLWLTDDRGDLTWRHDDGIVVVDVATMQPKQTKEVA